MRIRKVIVLIAAIAAASCSSTRTDSGLGNARVRVPDPDVRIIQISQVAAVARGITGGIPVQYRIRVANHAAEPITLVRVTVQSLGSGAYTLNPNSRAFDLKIQPEGFADAEFWAPATIEDATVYGANGPVTLRCLTEYDSPMGHFQNLVVQQVHENMLETQ